MFYTLLGNFVLVMSLGFDTQLRSGVNPMPGQGQGIGHDRSLCNGRAYRGYGVIVGFILIHTYGDKVKV